MILTITLIVAFLVFLNFVLLLVSTNKTSTKKSIKTTPPLILKGEQTLYGEIA